MRYALFKGLVLMSAMASMLGCTAAKEAGSATSISGKVSLGPVKGAAVAVYKVEEDGSRGALMGQGTTNDDGDYNIEVGEKSGAIEVVARGGEYEEEASGETVKRDADEEISSIVEDAKEISEVAITPLTDLAKERAKSLKEQGLDVKDAFKLAIAEIQNAAGVEDIIKPPVDPRRAQSAEGASEEARKKHALVLAGLSQMAKERGVSSQQIARALAEDFKEDGKFDGMSSGSPVPIDKSALVLGEKDWKTALPAAMDKFIKDLDRDPAGFVGSQIPEVKEILDAVVLPVKPPEPPTTRPKAVSIGIKAMPKAPTSVCMPVLLGTLDANKRPVPKGEDVAVGLTPAAGLSVYEDISCSVKTMSATINAFAGVRHVFVKATYAGSYSLTAIDSADVLASGSITIEFMSPPHTMPSVGTIYGGTSAASIALRGPPKIPRGVCVPVILNFLNDKEMPVPAGASRSFNLTSSDANLKTYSDPQCSTTSASISFAAPQVVATTFIKFSGDTLPTEAVTLSASVSVGGAQMAATLKVLVFKLQTSSPSNPIEKPPGPAKLELQGPGSLFEGNCAPFAVRQVSGENPIVPAEADADIDLTVLPAVVSSSPIATLHTDPQCTGNAIKKTTIKTGWAHSVFYVKMVAPGQFNIDAKVPDDSLIPASKTVVGYDKELSLPPPAKLLLKRPPTGFMAMACMPVGLFLASSTETGSIALPAPADLSIAVSSNNTVLKIYAGPECGMEIQTAKIRAGQAMATFYVRASAPANSVTVTAAVSQGLQSGTLTLPVN